MKWIKPQNTVENNGHILTSYYYHTVYPEGKETVSNKYIKRINNKEWEIFTVYRENKQAYYGIPLEGFGLLDCMILKENTRPFTKQELKNLTEVNIGMFGSYSGKLNCTYKIKITPCISKFTEEQINA